MLMKLLKKIFPKHLTETEAATEKHKLNHQRSRVAVERYKDVSNAVKAEIKSNHFARYLIYEKKQEQEIQEKEKENKKHEAE